MISPQCRQCIYFDAFETLVVVGDSKIGACELKSSTHHTELVGSKNWSCSDFDPLATLTKDDFSCCGNCVDFDDCGMGFQWFDYCEDWEES